MTKVPRIFRINEEVANNIESYFEKKWPDQKINANKIYNYIVEYFYEEVIQSGKKISTYSDFGGIKKQLDFLKIQNDISTYISLEMLKLIKHDPQTYRSVREKGTRENEIYNRILSIVSNDIEVSKKIKDSQIVR